MDIFVKFANLEQSLGRFKENAAQYMDFVSGLQDIAGSFEGGGFAGECGVIFNDLLQSDMSVISEFSQIFEQAAGLLGETIGEFSDTDENMKSQIPS
jgi:hypothetical protein